MTSTWKGAADWLRNNYHSYSNVLSICEAMEAAAPDRSAAADSEALSIQNLLTDVGALLAEFVEDGKPLIRAETRKLLTRVRHWRAQVQDRQPAVMAVASCESIVDVDGLPRLISNVISSCGHPDKLKALYDFINAWGDRRAAMGTAGLSAGWFFEVTHFDGSKTIKNTHPEHAGAFQLYRAPASGAVKDKA